jgi:hypothetical protein
MTSSLLWALIYRSLRDRLAKMAAHGILALTGGSSRVAHRHRVRDERILR